jgi:hypothetical protein
MGTWNLDTYGLAKHQPTKADKSRASIINRRWQEWKPLLEHELRTQGKSSFSKIERLRQIHMKACLRLFHLSVPMSFVTDTNIRIDDPRISDQQREDELSRLYWARPKVVGKLANRRNIPHKPRRHPVRFSVEAYVKEQSGE